VDIYVVIVEDRHIQPFSLVFSTAEKAITAAKELVKDLATYPNDITEENVDGWLYYCEYSIEGDSVWVQKQSLDPDPDTWLG